MSPSDRVSALGNTFLERSTIHKDDAYRNPSASEIDTKSLCVAEGCPGGLVDARSGLDVEQLSGNRKSCKHCQAHALARGPSLKTSGTSKVLCTCQERCSAPV